MTDRSRHGHIVLAAVLVLAGFRPPPAAAQVSADLDEWLSRPVSPGTLASLVNFPLTPPIRSRLADSLRHPRSDVRAAAARVAFVVGARDLTAAAAEALKVEQTVDAAVEQARLVAHFSNDDQTILDAWMRLDTRDSVQMLYALAAARGLPSLRLLPQVRAVDVNGATLASFVRVATRGDHDATTALATDALRDRDDLLFGAVLQSARTSRSAKPELSDALAVLGLRSEVPKIRFDSIWHVTRTWGPARPLPAPVRSALEHAVDSGLAPARPSDLFALELAARALGRRAGRTPGWNDLIDNPPAVLNDVFYVATVRALLTGRELEKLSDGLQRSPPLQKPTRHEQAQFAKPAGSGTLTSPMATVSDYPPGFMSDVFAVMQCNVAEAQKAGPGEALITFRPDGRAMNIALAPLQAPRGCADAVRVLMMTYVDAVDRVPHQEARLLLPLDAGFIACQDTSMTTPLRVETPRGSIQQPKKTLHVNPIYPQSAIDRRVQGVVTIESMITPTGCVARAEVTGTVDPSLDWSALRAVLGWRFTPTLLGTTPVPVVMTVTVQFSLN